MFVTTPNRWFPLEVHTLLPFVHWLPAGARERVIPFDDVLDPLGPKELASLFPYSVRVINTGMTLIAVGPIPLRTGKAGTSAPLSPPSSLRR